MILEEFNVVEFLYMPPNVFEDTVWRVVSKTHKAITLIDRKGVTVSLFMDIVKNSQIQSAQGFERKDDE